MRMILVCVLLLSVSGMAQAALLDPAEFDASRFLPPPPAVGPPDAKAEVSELKAIAARSTPDMVAAATRDGKDEGSDLFNAALGFDLTSLPATTRSLFGGR